MPPNKHQDGLCTAKGDTFFKKWGVFLWSLSDRRWFSTQKLQATIPMNLPEPTVTTEKERPELKCKRKKKTVFGDRSATV